MGWARCRGTCTSILPATSANHGYRFVLTSNADVKARQEKEAADVKSELANLDKKLHYLQTTYDNSQQHIRALFERGA